MIPMTFFNVETEQRITCTNCRQIERLFDNRDPTPWCRWPATDWELAQVRR